MRFDIVSPSNIPGVTYKSTEKKEKTVMITGCCIVIKFEYNKRCSHHIKLAFHHSHYTAQFNGVDT